MSCSAMPLLEEFSCEEEQETSEADDKEKHALAVNPGVTLPTQAAKELPWKKFAVHGYISVTAYELLWTPVLDIPEI